MPKKIVQKVSTADINTDVSVFDFITFSSKNKYVESSLELIDGSITSVIGKTIDSLNEFTIAAAAQNFSLYLKKNGFSQNVFITHDGSFHAILFSKIFASVLISDRKSTRLNSSHAQ